MATPGKRVLESLGSHKDPTADKRYEAKLRGYGSLV
jgi:hypothetical protein